MVETPSGAAPAPTPAPAPAPTNGGSGGMSSIFGGTNQTATSSQDPLTGMMKIAKDPDLTPADKIALINMANQRFKNRRRMAYFALFSIIGTLIFLLGGAVLDATVVCKASSAATECRGILTALAEAQTMISWIMGFLASIVAAYYGFSSIRPSS